MVGAAGPLSSESRAGRTASVAASPFDLEQVKNFSLPLGR
jgi:hypothetical protein